MKIDREDLVVYKFYGEIECKSPSTLGTYLHNLYISGMIGIGTLSDLGYSGDFYVVDTTLIDCIDEDPTVLFQIRSAPEDTKPEKTPGKGCILDSAGIVTRVVIKDDAYCSSTAAIFEDVYKGYVIRIKGGMKMFIGPDTDRYRVMLRAHAARFTKAEALDYIQNGSFCEQSEEYVIEDAT